MKKFFNAYITAFCFLLVGVALILCGSLRIYAVEQSELSTERALPLSPAYEDSITIPPNIGILALWPKSYNYNIKSVVFEGFKSREELLNADQTLVISPWPKSFSDKQIKSWRALLDKVKGGYIRVSIYATEVNSVDVAANIPHRFKTLTWFVAKEPIDPYLLYRNSIYEDETYNHVVLEEANMEELKKRLILDNSKMDNCCINCHAINKNNSREMVVHLRGSLPGTLLIKGKKVVKIKIPDEYTNLRLTYPSWRSQGDLIAFSTNQVYSQHYSFANRKGIITVDTLGSIVLLDTKSLSLFSSDLLTDTLYNDVFPHWAADGKSLFFCRSPRRGTAAWNEGLKNEQSLKNKKGWSQWDSVFMRPSSGGVNSGGVSSGGASSASDFKSTEESIEEANVRRYNLMQIDFDPISREFSNLRCVAKFSDIGKSVAIPHINASMNLMVLSVLETTSFPLQVYGDFYKVYLNEKTAKTGDNIAVDAVESCYRVETVPELNTKGAESGHSFSSNGKWMVFMSNRETFAIPEPYIAYVFEDGSFGRPFIMPQRENDFYSKNVRAFSFPVLSKVSSLLDASKLAKSARQTPVLLKVEGLEQFKVTGGRAAKSGH